MALPPKAPSKNTIRVTIFNQTYTVAVSGDPGEAERLASQVDQLMVDIASRTGYGDSLRIAVLACLHLADRLRAAQNQVEGLQSRAANLNHEISSIFDERSLRPSVRDAS